MIKKILGILLGACLAQLLGCTMDNLKFVSSVAGDVGKGVDEISTRGVEVANVACPEISEKNFGSLALGASAKVQAETKAFLMAVHNLEEYATWMNRGARAHCTTLGVALGLPKRDLQSKEKGPYGGAEEICSAVARQFTRIGAKVQVSYQAPTCSWPLDQAQTCLAACGTELRGPTLAASCKGGKLTGTCDGSCNGTCDGAAQAQAQAPAQAPAETDAGVGADADANAAAAASAAAAAKCAGKCSGECDGTFKAVSCDGKFEPPAVDSNCNAACLLEATSSIKCSDPSLTANVTGGAPNLKAALQEELPRLIQIATETGTRGADQVEALLKTGAKLKGDLGSVGGKALTCVGAGITLATAAGAKIVHSVKATVEVRGMVGGKLGI